MKNAIDIKNILLISLDDKFAKSVAVKLADALDMFIADTRELIEYDLVDSKTVLKTCGLEYLKKRERKTVDKISTYENTVITINIDIFKEYFEHFKNSIVIYLRRKQKQISKTVNKIGFDNYDEFLTEKSDLYINLEKSSVENAVKTLMQKIKKTDTFQIIDSKLKLKL